MINRYFNRTPYQGELYTPPLQAIQQALETSQKRYDFNAAGIDELQNRYLDALEPDRIEANTIQEKYNKTIDERIKGVGDDLSRLDLYSLKREIEKDFKPGSKGYAIAQNKAMFDQLDKEARDRVKSGKVSSDRYLKWKVATKNTYKGAVQDPVTKEYQGLPSVPLTDNYNVGEKFDKLATALHAVKYQAGDWEVKGGYVKSPEEREGKSFERLRGAFTAGLVGDSEFNAFLQGEAALNGTTVQQEALKYQDIVDNAALNYAWDSLAKGSDLKVDEWAKQKAQFAHDYGMERARAQSALGLAAFKHQLDNSVTVPSGSETGIRYPATTNANGSYKPVQFNADGSVYRSDGVIPTKPNTLATSTESYQPVNSRYTTYSVTDLLKDPAKATEQGMDYVVLKGLADTGLTGAALIDKYNKTIASSDYKVSITNGVQITEENTRKALTANIFANASAYSVKEVGPDGTKEGNLADYLSVLQNKEGNPIKEVGSYELPESGITSGGYSIELGNGKRLVIEPATNVKQALDRISKSHRQALATGTGTSIPSLTQERTPMIPKSYFDPTTNEKSIRYYLFNNPNQVFRRNDITDRAGNKLFPNDSTPLTVEDYQELETKPLFNATIPSPKLKGSWSNQGIK